MANVVKQYADQPLFPDILWNRPLRRTGRVLLMGGHRDGFAALQRTYTGFDASGIAECRLAVPSSLAKLLGSLQGTSLLPSTPSGSIARDSLAELVALSNEADAVCLGPDLSNNSETTLTAERLMTETGARVIIPSQSLTALLPTMSNLATNPNVLLLTTIRQFFELVGKLRINKSVSPAIQPDNIAALAAELTQQYQPSLIVVMNDSIIVATDGQASITPASLSGRHQAEFVGLAGTFWLQHPGKAFEALTTAASIAAQSVGDGSFLQNVKAKIAQS